MPQYGFNPYTAEPVYEPHTVAVSCCGSGTTWANAQSIGAVTLAFPGGRQAFHQACLTRPEGTGSGTNAYRATHIPGLPVL